MIISVQKFRPNFHPNSKFQILVSCRARVAPFAAVFLSVSPRHMSPSYHRITLHYPPPPVHRASVTYSGWAATTVSLPAPCDRLSL